MAGGREPGRAAAIPGSVSARLLRLEARLARAERQLRAALALRGRLQALERRLERGGRRGASGPRGPARLRAPWAPFGERERRALPGWRRALRRAPRRSPRGALLPRGKGPGEGGMGEGWSWGRGSGDPRCTLRHKEVPRGTEEPPQLAPWPPYTPSLRPRLPFQLPCFGVKPLTLSHRCQPPFFFPRAGF